MSFGHDFTRDYEERSKEYMDNLDFQKLDAIKSKELRDLTNDDLLTLGFKEVNDDGVDSLFCYEDLNGIKVYVNRVGDKFELRGFQLRKEKDINSTAELLDETLTKWRLKMK
jgi:hypothetical protein